MPDHWSTAPTTVAGIDLHLDLDQPGGRRATLERVLRTAIREGRLTAGTALPSTRALAHDLGISRGTVAAAYDQLVAEGYLTARQGSGTVVTDTPAPSAAKPLRQAPPSHPDAPTAADHVQPLHDLRPGRPDLTAFPRTAWLRATRHVLATAPPHLLGSNGAQGLPALRAALADYLGRTRGVITSPDRIIVCSGYVQGLALLAKVLADTGRGVIALEDPGLPHHRATVRHAGAHVVPLPVDDLGARTDTLSTPAFDGVGAAVVTAAHQYPTGAPLHPSRRQALIDWARTTGAVVIEDDYDGEFRYDRQPVGAVQGMAPDHVVHAGTTSKTLAPGLRLAWLALPEHLVGPVADAKAHTDGYTHALDQLVLADLITDHTYDRHIRAARLRYRRRRDLLVARLAAHHPTLRVRGISAGLHALIDLDPSGPTEQDILARAADHRLALYGLAPHFHAAPPDEYRPGIIAGYGTPSESGYPAAIDALISTLSESTDAN